MSQDPFDFLSRIEELSTEAELVTAFDEALRRLGFDAVTYGAGRVVDGALVSARIASTLSPAWIAYYAERGFYRSDRLVARALSQITPFAYAEVFERPRAMAVQQEMENTLFSLGFRAGVVVPLHGPHGFGIVSAASSLREGEVERLRPEVTAPLALIAAYFHERMLQLLGPEQDRSGLHARERECLLWAGQGKTVWEISVILSLSQSTVKKHLVSAAAKLGVATRAQAVARATARGLIRP